MKTKPFLLAATLLATSSLMAATRSSKTAPAAPPLPEVLAKYDTNGDGKLDATELAAMKADLEAQRKALIAKYDINGDGVLDATERAAMEADMKAQHLAELTAKFAEIDADSSGGITLAEFTAGAPKGASTAQVQASFNRLDTDKDGLISLAEFVAAPPHGGGPHGPPPGSTGTSTGTGTTSTTTSRSSK